MGRKRTKSICKHCLHWSIGDGICCEPKAKKYGKKTKAKSGCDEFEPWKKGAKS
jgi:hypothetical protein